MSTPCDRITQLDVRSKVAPRVHGLIARGPHYCARNAPTACTTNANKGNEMRGLLVALLLLAAAETYYAGYLLSLSDIELDSESVGESGGFQKLELGSGGNDVPVMVRAGSGGSGDQLLGLPAEGGGSRSGGGSGSGAQPFINVVY